MSDTTSESTRLDLSRERLRTVLQEGAAMPGHRDNPWMLAGTFAKEAVDTAVRPLAQDHPVGLVAGAAVLGALLVWSRPWRWVATPLLASLLPQLIGKAMQQAPTRQWVDLLGSIVSPVRSAARGQARTAMRTAQQVPR